MRLGTALRLGRVSNLPTVWSNTLVGVVLAGAVGVPAWEIAVLLLTMSLFYTGGMYLNDAFDWRIDAEERPERPIPAGDASLAIVAAAGLIMLVGGIVLLAWLGQAGSGQSGWRPALAGVALAAVILYYDWRHKSDPLSPLWMGVCRMLIYLGAGYAVMAEVPTTLFIAACVLLCYLIGLTYIAKQENLGAVGNLWPLIFLAVPVVYGALNLQGGAGVILLAVLTAWILYALNFLRRRQPGDIPRAVLSLIAGMSLLDALLIANAGSTGLAILAVAAFACTLAFQRLIPGT